MTEMFVTEDAHARYDNLLEEVALWKARAIELQYIAFHDKMTGCLNRAGMYDEISHWQYRFVYVIDLNGLKVVNDTLGHQAGDKLLLDAVKVMNEIAAAGNGFVCRVGGDEFVILSQRLVHAGRIDLFSHGWAVIKKDGPEGLDAALVKADVRMYTRKRSRKDHRKTAQKG